MTTTSSGSITSTTINGRSRITGLSSGIDVDSMVKQMMSAEKANLNKMTQQEQLVEWRQDAYRDVISAVQSFTNKYFDLTSSNSLLRQSSYKKFSVSSDSTAIVAEAGGGAVPGTHSITVSQLATAATRESASNMTKAIQGTKQPDYIAAQGSSFAIQLDGTSRTVSIDNTVTDMTSLQTTFDKAIGAGKVTVGTIKSNGSDVLTLKATDNSGVQKITLAGTSTSALDALGFGNGAYLSNRINTSAKLGDIAQQLNSTFNFNSDGQVEFKVNGVNFTFDQDETFDTMMSEINSSTSANVTMKYDDLADKLVMQAKQTGAGNTIDVSESGSTFLQSFMNINNAGQDAKMIVDGQNLTRSSNSVAVDGVTYTVNQMTTVAANVTIKQDADGIYKNIESFVDDYNTLMDKVNSKLSEKYDRNYPPLTDDQKSSMSEDDIKNWEAKAKTGLLQNDSLLQNFADTLREALIDPVSGQSTNLYSIGITSGTYSEKGKLYIDEDKLKQAIQDNPDGVANLFAQQSSSYPGSMAVDLDGSKRQTRYNEEGIAYRFYDIIQNNISTLPDLNGNKGLMIAKAGLKGTSTEYDNSMTNEIADWKVKISGEQDRLNDVEERYYTEFDNMETYINQLSSQMSSLNSSGG